MITVGIPVYNAEKFLEKAVLSVLRQTYEDFELILSDDGSTDRSLEIIKSFNDPRIVVVSDGRNHGISYRLNEQIAKARGKYFFRMDGDDLMFPQRIEKQVEFLDQNTDIDVVGSAAVIINDEDAIIGFRTPTLPKTFVEAVKASTFIHPTVAGKTAWFKKFGYDGELNGAEDYALWLNSRERSKFGMIEEPLLFYRDPLKFKLKTYLFRLAQQRKIFRTNEYLKANKNLQVKMLVLSHFKGGLARIATTAGIEDKYIARRNAQASGSNPADRYTEILGNILKNKQN